MGTRKSAAEKITEDKAKEIISYFSNHTATSTVQHFNLNRCVLTKLLAKYNIPLHSQKMSETFKHLEHDKYDLYSKEQIQNIYQTYEKLGIVEDTCEACDIKEYFLVYLLTTKNLPIIYRPTAVRVQYKSIPNDIKQQVVAFYNIPNTLTDTATKFKLQVYQVHAIISELNQPFHDRATIEALGKAKQKNNLRAKYGVSNVFQLENVKQKSRQTKLAKYGDETFTNPAKRGQTCLEKYGAKTFLESSTGKQAVIDYSKKQYGTDYAFQSTEWQHNKQYLEKRKQTIAANKYNLNNFSTKYLATYNDKEALAKLVNGKTFYEIATELSITTDHAHYLLDKMGLLDLVNREFHATSHYESEIVNFIGEDLCVRNDRAVLNGKEIDIYIPSKKIGIEFNGTR